MFVVTVTYRIHSDCVEDFREAIEAHAAGCRAEEEACVLFDVCTDAAHPTCFFLYEVYRTEDGFRAHLETARYKAFIQKIGTWIDDKVVDQWRRLTHEGPDYG
jgi:quinol monooxygenase YgiN